MGKDIKILGGIGIITLIIVIVAAFTMGGKPAEKPGEEKVLDESQTKLLVRKDSYSVNSPEAKVTLVEFADFQCPACSTAHSVVLSLKNEFKGKVNFVFREYPLIQAHKNAYNAALAAESAGAQGKFWQMHDMLFENQDKWSDENDPLKIFEGYAKEIGIDVNKFTKDVKDKKYESRIQTDISDANQLGINSTPTFYLNDKVIVGVLPYDDFKKKIEEELKN